MPKMPRHFLVAAIILGSLLSTQVYGGEQSKNAPPVNPNPSAAAPVGKVTPAANKSAAADTKPAASAVTATAPAETTKAPAQTPAATDIIQKPTATNASAAKPAPGTHDLRSLSVIEILISLVLLAIFFLVLFKGNIFKHHH